MEPSQQGTSYENIRQAQAAAGEAAAAVAPLMKRLREQSRRAYLYADQQMQSRPRAAAGLAFAVGTLFGVVIALASSSRRQ